MTLQAYLSLALQTVTNPREVARLLMSMRLTREALFTAFALVVVLNAFMYAASLQLAGPGELDFLQNPVMFLFLQAVTLGATIVCLTWAGRGIGGAARMDDMALLMIWMQSLRVLVQLAVMLIILVSPAIASALVGLSMVLGLYIAASFVNEAQGFDSFGRAVLSMVMGVLGAVFALSLLLTLLGVQPNGLTVG